MAQAVKSRAASILAFKLLPKSPALTFPMSVSKQAPMALVREESSPRARTCFSILMRASEALALEIFLYLRGVAILTISEWSISFGLSRLWGK